MLNQGSTLDLLLSKKQKRLFMEISAGGDRLHNQANLKTKLFLIVT